jgi:primosomal protein N' (replication factor Y)
MSKQSILKVAISVPLSRQFDYLLPPGLVVEPGCRVLVQFGPRRLVGLALETAAESDYDVAKLRPIVEVLDDSPLLRPSDLWLLRFTANYYHHPIGEVVAAALPALLRQGKPVLPITECYAAADAAQATDIEGLAKRAPKQAELLETLLDAGGNGLDTETLTELLPNWRRVAKPLLEKGLIARFEIRALEFDDTDAEPATQGPTLNADQEAALDALRETDAFSVSLIDGVTGSGKTEVYLSRMRDVLEQGKQVLVLVPEIGLTPQLVDRLQRRLGLKPALLHSGLTDLQRLASWRAARSGAARLVVGTRSAIFVPLAKPGMIIIDEEHDHSFKQQEGLRYSARDLAIARAKHLDVPVVLGSATPTLEMLQHCRSGNYRHILLPTRAGGAKPPRMRLVDISRSAATDGISATLADVVSTHLAAEGQVLLFLNRRGFAPTLICAGCGHIAECARCDSRMTVHARDNTLRCHHCGAQRPLDQQCDDCGSPMRPLGEGTQRLEDALANHFPGYTISRIDSDSTQRKGAMDEALSQAADGSANILVGTQMLSKGHHFPKLTLVGVINADQGLFGTDFRCSERLAQSIVQVAGRAGREDRAGEVLIQTSFPEHPFWKTLLEGGYPRVAEEALAERENTRWPPYTRLALLRSAATRRADAHAFLHAARTIIEEMDLQNMRVLGPVDAPMARRAGRYRAQLLLQSGDRQGLHKALSQLRPALEAAPAARKVRWSVDIDPIELF